MTAALLENDRRELLERARRRAAEAVGAKGSPAAPRGEPTSEALLAPGAAFVTWRKAGRLRGCIGSVTPTRPLWLDVEEHAADALVSDPRFPPATARDLPELELAISVLGPLERISSWEDLTLGVHGTFVSKGRRSALMLPKVATEWDMTLPELWEQTCLKAGLPGDAFKAPGGIALYRFVTEDF
ncbi:MAG: AmmeMemoRadiSam system protein A [Acidobacteria bacterium]|nr:AmmeMemoRadiSam system protein A [Acidobacteriota bacterium]